MKRGRNKKIKNKKKNQRLSLPPQGGPVISAISLNQHTTPMNPPETQFVISSWAANNALADGSLSSATETEVRLVGCYQRTENGEFRVNEAVVSAEAAQWPVRNQAALIPIGPGTSGATQPDEVYLAKLRVSHTLRPALPWNSLSRAVNGPLVFWIVSAGFEIALSAWVQSQRPRSSCTERYIIFRAFGLRRETEVHTGKQWRANTQIFSSTLRSEEGCFGITRPRLGVVNLWGFLSCPETCNLSPTESQENNQNMIFF